jgi:hypothetical protein
MRKAIWLWCAAGLAVAACDRAERPSDDAGARAVPTGNATAGKPTIGPKGTGEGITIEYDPGSGKSRVKGGSALTGDPKSCAAFRACCTLPDMGLMCGLIEAGGGDCAAALKQARDHIAELKLKAPAGCR